MAFRNEAYFIENIDYNSMFLKRKNIQSDLFVMTQFFIFAEKRKVRQAYQ